MVNISKYKKIHIVGGPGSGKTYLANKLSKKLKIKNYELDDIFWKGNSFSVKQDPKIRDKKLLKLLKNKKWITEGVFVEWVESCFKKADIVIFLKINIFIRTFRIIKRSLIRVLGIEKSKRKENFKEFIIFLRYVIRYRKRYHLIEKKLGKRKKEALIIRKANFNIKDFTE